jgi:hypothetical protein
MNVLVDGLSTGEGPLPGCSVYCSSTHQTLLRPVSLEPHNAIRLLWNSNTAVHSDMFPILTTDRKPRLEIIRVPFDTILL